MDVQTRRDALTLAAASTAVLLGASGLSAQEPSTTARPVEGGDEAINAAFADIDRKIQQLDLRAYEPGGPRAVTADEARANPANVLQNICPIYQGIRGILVALGDFPLLPGPWRVAIKKFVQVMDVICV